ncbi:MAG: carboxypeptidase N/E family protein, partial [Thermoplasmata archaeon]
MPFWISVFGVLVLSSSLLSYDPSQEEWVKFQVSKERISYVERELGVSVAHYEDGWDEAILRPGERGRLKKAGFTLFEVANLDSLKDVMRTWAIDFEYHTYLEMKTELELLASTYPTLCQLDTIGYSVQGRQILALKISDNPDQREFEPEVRIVGCHHGNERPSAEIPLYLAQYLLENYDINNQIKDLVDNREIWIVPMFNPDGHESYSRYNAHGIDLNRDYGYMWEGWGGSPSPYSQPETEAMMLFSQEHNFVLSLSFHSYGEIVNYIWNFHPVPPPDSLILQQLSYEYASYNGYWVTEGYDWYETHGDLNDYSHGIDSDLDWTIEIGSSFNPPPSQLQGIWLDNRDATLQFIKRAGQGIAGFVFDAQTGDTLKNAIITVQEIGWPVFSDPLFGDYHRVLLPGTYTIEAQAPGYQSQTISGVAVVAFEVTRVDFYLQPGGDGFCRKFIIANIADPYNYFSNVTLTPWALGAPDNLFASIGRGGMVVLDFGAFYYDLSGDDITVNEG